MKRRFDPVSSEILYGMEKSSVYRMHINKVTRAKPGIDSSKPELSSRHKIIQERQAQKRKKMLDQMKKNKRYIYEYDVESRSTLSIPAKLSILNQTMKSSDTRAKVKDVSERPVFSVAAHNFNFDEDIFEEESAGEKADSEIFIDPEYVTQSTLSPKKDTKSKSQSMLSSTSSQKSTTLPQAKTLKTTKIDYSLIPGMHIIDEILKVELSDDTSTDDDSDASI